MLLKTIKTLRIELTHNDCMQIPTIGYGYTTKEGLHLAEEPEADIAANPPRKLASLSPYGAVYAYTLTDGNELLISVRSKCDKCKVLAVIGDMGDILL